jgi:hypothetical protein
VTSANINHLLDPTSEEDQVLAIQNVNEIVGLFMRLMPQAITGKRCGECGRVQLLIDASPDHDILIQKYARKACGGQVELVDIDRAEICKAFGIRVN